VSSPPLNGEMRENNILPGYVFYGEETFLADEFVDQIRGLMAASVDEDFHADRFYLDEAKWPEIIDAARAVPFLFQNWRLIVVRVPERKAVTEKGGGRREDEDGEEAKGIKYFGALDQKIIRGYFAEPPSRTVLVIILGGKIKKNDAAVRFFSSLPERSVLIQEIKPLPAAKIKKWAEGKAQTLAKTLTEAAKDRLFEILGSDLRLMKNEIEKLAVFVGDKKGIDEADVNQATAWLRSFEVYELDEALVNGDFEKGVGVLGSLLAEGEKPEFIIAKLTTYFKNVLSAQAWLREKSRDREEIFRAFFPYIQKTYADLYRQKYGEFFGVVDGLSPEELNSVLRALQRADIRIKTTDSVPRTVLEMFLQEYCLLRKKKKAISRG